VLFLAIIFLGVYPAPLLDVIQHATDAILSPSGATGLVPMAN
jgi:NADH:ubiquinone oxidoreductase subunit 4 (subunit M)